MRKLSVWFFCIPVLSCILLNTAICDASISDSNRAESILQADLYRRSARSSDFFDVFGPDGDDVNLPAHRPDEILVKFSPTRDSYRRTLDDQEDSTNWLDDKLSSLRRTYGIQEAEAVLPTIKSSKRILRSRIELSESDATEKPQMMRHDLSLLYRLKIKPQSERSLSDLLDSLNRDPQIEYAELNYQVSTHRLPDDPLLDLQWGLDHIGAAQAWDRQTGDDTIIVAVIDSGADHFHRDLNGNLWVNAAEKNGLDGVDDDDNGYIDDIYGYNFAYNDNAPSDDHGHGTHCSGIISAVTDNGYDVAGICWNVQIMPLKFVGPSGSGFVSDAVRAMLYAVDNGARVTSNSWGGPYFSYAMYDAIRYAHAQGVVVVASAGNAYDDTPQYPAAYDHVLAVAAMDSEGNKAAFSSYGDWADLAAPGVEILSLRAKGTSMANPYDDYTTYASGTSMACPFVSGASALLMSMNPTLEPNDYHYLIMSSSQPLNWSVWPQAKALQLDQAVNAIKGSIVLNQQRYRCDDAIDVTLFDSDLLEEANQPVYVESDSGDFETLLLQRQLPVKGKFTRSMPISLENPVPEDHSLQVAHGDTIYVYYKDLNDSAVYDACAVVDCRGPQLLDLQIDANGPRPEILFESDEPAIFVLTYFPITDPNTAQTVKAADFDRHHTVVLGGITPYTEYAFYIEMQDVLGNKTIYDNNAVFYEFTSNGPQDLYVPRDYPTIKQAVHYAWDGSRILLADGIYRGPGNRDIRIQSGGLTITSLNGPENCVIDPNYRGRAFILINNDSNTILEGLTIRNGSPYYESTYPDLNDDRQGAAIYCSKSSLQLHGCRFIQNIAPGSGGAIFATDSNLSVNDCLFHHNQALAAGAIYCVGELVISHSLIIGNIAESGAGIQASGDVTIDQCVLLENRSTGNLIQTGPAFIEGYGGAIRCHYSDLKVTNSIIRNNQSNFGGGIFYVYSDALIQNCVIANNTAIYGGGICDNGFPDGALIYYGKTGTAQIVNCTVCDNKAVYSTVSRAGGAGGGIFTGGRSTTEMSISNSILYGNQADEGPQLYIQDVTYMLEPNCWDPNNPYCEDPNCWEPNDANCWDPNLLHPLDVMSRAYVQFNLIEDGLGGIFDTNSLMFYGPSNCDMNPRFALDGDYHLLRHSPCIDAGTNTPNNPLLLYDLDGGTRVVDGDGDGIDFVDVGAYEYAPRRPTIAVEPGFISVIVNAGTIKNIELQIRNASSGRFRWMIDEDIPWLTAYPKSGRLAGGKKRISLQIDTTELHQGEYLAKIKLIAPRAINSPRDIPVRLYVRDNIRVPQDYQNIELAMKIARDGDMVVVADGVYDGKGNRDLFFNGKSMTVRSENGPFHCIIDCNGQSDDSHRGFNFVHRESNDAVLDGFTIRNGFVAKDFFSLFPPWDGAGIYCYSSNPTIQNCILENNRAGYWGGGLYSFWTKHIKGKMDIVNCRFINNTAGQFGGGIWTDNDVVVNNSLFNDNYASLRGGAVFCQWSSQRFNNCTLVRNTAGRAGGGGL